MTPVMEKTRILWESRATLTVSLASRWTIDFV